MFASSQKKGKDDITLKLGFSGSVNVKFIGKKKKGGGGKKKVKPPRISRGIILLEGRHFCDCEGNLHEIVTNCSFCGRIVCEQEGFGECFFCKNEVVGSQEATEEAIRRRNEMVNYDKKGSQIIIDDQMDHFESNIWVHKTKKDDLRKKQKKLKELQKKIIDEESLEKFQELEREMKQNVNEEEDLEDDKEEVDGEKKKVIQSNVHFDPYAGDFRIEGKFSNVQKKKKKKIGKFSENYLINEEIDRVQTDYFYEEEEEYFEEKENL